MTNPHHSMSHPLDPHPVRPGTSAALTARTIDATIHPPLVRAQEAVAAFIPRVSAPLLESPLLFGMLGATLIFVWVAHRAKYRPSALLLSAGLVMALTSFQPLSNAEEAPVADDSSATEQSSWTPPLEQNPPDDVQPNDYSSPSIPDAYSVPQMPDQVATPSYVDVPAMPADVHVRMVTPEALRRMLSSEAIRQMMTPEDRAVLERERAQLEIAIIQMRRQLRDEARRMAKKRYY